MWQARALSAAAAPAAGSFTASATPVGISSVAPMAASMAVNTAGIGTGLGAGAAAGAGIFAEGAAILLEGYLIHLRSNSIAQYNTPFGSARDLSFPLLRNRYNPPPLPTSDPQLTPEPPPIIAKTPTPDVNTKPEAGPKQIPIQITGSAPQTKKDEDKKRREPSLYYVVYTKVDLKTGELYAGRARGLVLNSQAPKVGDLLPIIYRREGQEGEKHHTVGRYGPAVIENFARATKPLHERKNDPAYEAIRGREQQLIDSQGGAWSDVGRLNTNSGNSIRGVAADNLQGRKFHEASNRYFGRLAPYTGF